MGIDWRVERMSYWPCETGCAKIRWEGVHYSSVANVDAIDWQIERLVYELYSLTDDEIRILKEVTEL